MPYPPLATVALFTSPPLIAVMSQTQILIKCFNIKVYLCSTFQEQRLQSALQHNQKADMKLKQQKIKVK